MFNIIENRLISFYSNFANVVDKCGRFEYIKIALISAFGLLVILREPDLFWHARFWAEEGIIYFQDAYNKEVLDSLLSANLGYYSLFNKIASISAANLVPLEYAPNITTLFSFAVMLLPVTLLVYSKTNYGSNYLLICGIILLILLVQPNQEVWLNTVNSQFFLCLATAIILISNPSGAVNNYLRITTLVLSGLTGVVSCLLFPFFWVEYYFSRDRYKLIEAIAITLVTLIQLLIVIFAANERGGSEVYLSLIPLILFSKQWLLPLLGNGVSKLFYSLVKQNHLWKSELFLLLTLLPYFVTAFVLIIKKNRHAWILFLASLFISIISITKAANTHSFEAALQLVSDLHGGRYFYAPNVMLAISLFLPYSNPPETKSDYKHLYYFSFLPVLMMLVIGIYDFIHSSNAKQFIFFNGADWRTEVQQYKLHNSKISVWPEAMPKMSLKKIETPLLDNIPMSCATMDKELNITLPCIVYKGVVLYKPVLNKISLKDKQSSLWALNENKLNPVKLKYNQQCALVDKRLNMTIPCLEKANNKNKVSLDFIKREKNRLVWRMEDYEPIIKSVK